MSKWNSLLCQVDKHMDPIFDIHWDDDAFWVTISLRLVCLEPKWLNISSCVNWWPDLSCDKTHTLRRRMWNDGTKLNCFWCRKPAGRKWSISKDQKTAASTSKIRLIKMEAALYRSKWNFYNDLQPPNTFKKPSVTGQWNSPKMVRMVW